MLTPNWKKLIFFSKYSKGLKKPRVLTPIYGKLELTQFFERAARRKIAPPQYKNLSHALQNPKDFAKKNFLRFLKDWKSDLRLVLFWNSGLWKKGEFVNVWGTPWAEGPAPRVGDEIFGTLNNPHTSTLTIWERFGTCTRPSRAFGSVSGLVFSHPEHLAVTRDFNSTCTSPPRPFGSDSGLVLSHPGHLAVFRDFISTCTSPPRPFGSDWGLQLYM